MARGFKRKGRGDKVRYAATLDAVERSVVIGLLEQVHELLAPPEVVAGSDDPFDQIVAGMGGLGVGVSVAAEDQEAWPTTEPVPEDARSFGDRDPALQRLLPSANRKDDQVSAEFRRLTEDGLRRRKADNVATTMLVLRREGNHVETTPAEAQAMLVALTDVRLVLGERLGLRDDDDVDRLEQTVAGMPDDAPIVYAAAVYDFLTWLQETLAGALLGSLGTHGIQGPQSTDGSDEAPWRER